MKTKFGLKEKTNITFNKIEKNMNELDQKKDIVMKKFYDLIWENIKKWLKKINQFNNWDKMEFFSDHMQTIIKIISSNNEIKSNIYIMDKWDVRFKEINKKEEFLKLFLEVTKLKEDSNIKEWIQIIFDEIDNIKMWNTKYMFYPEIKIKA